MPNFGTDFSALLWVVGIFGLVNLPCVSAWVLLGTGIRRWLTNVRLQILFSRGIAILMLYAAATIWL